MTPLAADLAIGQDAYLLLGAGLFAIGLVGLMVRKSALIMLMCVELMLNAVNLTLVSSRQTFHDRVGQMVVFFVMVVAAAEVTVGLGLIVALMRRRPNATADDVAVLRG